MVQPLAFALMVKPLLLFQWYAHLLLLCVRPSLSAILQPSAFALIQSTLAIVPPLLLRYERPLLLGVWEIPNFGLDVLDAQRGSSLCSNVGCLSALA